MGCRISEEGNASGTIEQGESGIAGRGQGFGCHQKGAGIGIPQRVPGVCVAGGADPALSPQSMESQVEEWYREVGELQAQTAALPLEPASKELVGERQNAVGERLVRLLEPLQERRRLLLASKELHQVAHDLDDELVRIRAGIRGGARVRAGGVRGWGGQRGRRLGGGGPWDLAGSRVATAGRPTH